jgi:small conductance mechanosensitive channel
MQDYLSRLENIDELIRQYAIPFSLKILGAISVWIIGGFLIRIVQRLIRKALHQRFVDATLVNYANATSSFILKAFLILAILGIFGIETTSFSALLAATGVAIGMAWSGLLSNFAAGIFLIVLRPFKVGDVITAAGITGTVREIGLFATTIDNGDNLRIFVGNNKIFSDNIHNYSTNAHRALAFRIQLPGSVEPTAAIEKLMDPLKSLPNLKVPVTGEITEFNPLGVVITLKTGCSHVDHQTLLGMGNQRLYEVLKRENYLSTGTATVLINR